MNGVNIIRAERRHLNKIARLFDAYRVFYEQPSNQLAAREFIERKFEKDESAIFLAVDDSGRGLGFTQLYPSFSSVSMKRLWILNDLYVDDSARRQGVARALMERAQLHAAETGAKGLILETAADNTPAQRLYESLGWKKDEQFYRYELNL